MADNKVAKSLNKLPQVVKTFIGRINAKGKFIPGSLSKDGGTVQELKSLRSELLREVRAEKAKDAPDRAKISLLQDLQQSLLADMDVPGDDALTIALGFSRGLNQRFRQGDVGMILGYQKSGEGAVPSLLIR